MYQLKCTKNSFIIELLKQSLLLLYTKLIPLYSGRREVMQEFQIAIHSFPEVQEFVSIATVQPFPVLVGSDKQMVNAKSFIGMVNLDYSHPLKVMCDCDEEPFQHFFRQADRFLA